MAKKKKKAEEAVSAVVVPKKITEDNSLFEFVPKTDRDTFRQKQVEGIPRFKL